MKKPVHGGRLLEAVARYGIPASQWLDLSAALNPEPWPVPAIPTAIWQRLPEEEDGLHAAAHKYYIGETYGQRNGMRVLATPGTQWSIGQLPSLAHHGRVYLPRTGYAEHAFCWHQRGFALSGYNMLPDPNTLAHNDIVVIINPNNPTATMTDPASIIAMLAARKHLGHAGLVIVDEAFIDATPEKSLLASKNTLEEIDYRALVVLRSFGKFFGLAGIRLGFACCHEHIYRMLQARLDPWAINHPARWIATHALVDETWQTAARIHLIKTSAQLHGLLTRQLKGIKESRRTPLFATTRLSPQDAAALHEHLSAQGILTRTFIDEGLVRFGIPATPADNQRLEQALRGFIPGGDPHAGY